eukprot:TRINITY_DN16292_c0_g1_i1.p1 TRINITY_DN16292_c0_g1~~TRINITY_DN16292_c0_g1_i1.p1  ORF type:complete len:381 (+),score=52.14 TRINITY_DN16292_c0_g1_i1:43-1185(+)
MSITIYVRTPAAVHDVEVAGSDTLHDLHNKVAEAANMAIGRFILYYEKNELEDDKNEEIMSTLLTEGCEVRVCSAVFTVLAGKLEEQNSVIELRIKEDPDLLLVIDLSDVKDGELHLGGDALPSNFRRLRVIDPEHKVTRLGRRFLYNTRLEEVDLSRLGAVTSIGSGFMQASWVLTSLDLSCFVNVKDVGDRFLFNCGRLTEVDLTPFQHIKEIGDHFLEQCKSLTKVDLSFLSEAHTIGSNFMASSGIVTIDLTGLEHVTKIRDVFLGECFSLVSIDLTPLKHVDYFGSFFLAGCNGLVALNLTPLQNATFIGAEFGHHCTSLELIDLTPLATVRTVSRSIFSGCTSLQHVSLDPPIGVLPHASLKTLYLTHRLQSTE